MQHAGEWFGQAGAFGRNILADFVQRFGWRSIELGQPAVAEDSKRGHVLANVRKP